MKRSYKVYTIALPNNKVATFKLKQKDQSYLMWIFYFFVFLFNRDFMTSTWTTFLGTIYVPGKNVFDDAFIKKHKSTLIHEGTHILQMKKYHILFMVSYILPPILSYGRYYWEREAYLNGLLSYRDRLTDSQLKAQIDAIASVLSGPHYLWAWPKKSIIKWFNSQLDL